MNAESVFAQEKLDTFLKTVKQRHGQRFKASVAVRDIDTGRLVFDSQGATPLIPASVLKIVTSVAALKLLGSDYRFPTEVFVDRDNAARLARKSSRGNAGNLYFRGYGDPGLVDESLWKIAQAVMQQGIEEVENIVVDDSLFIEPTKVSGSRPYQAGLSATTLNHNSYAITVVPTVVGRTAEVHLTPGVPYLLTNRVETVAGGGNNVILSQVPQSQSYATRRARGNELTELGVPDVRVVVKGSLGIESGPQTFYHSVPDPAANVAGALRALLTQSGVKVNGKLLSGETPATAKLLQVFESRSLGHLLADLNQFSNNVIAGQLLFALGQDEVGYFKKPLAIRRIEAFLRKLGIASEEFSIHDGSGLDRSNRLSSRALTTVLYDAYKDFAISADLVASLSRFNRTGTLRKRKLIRSRGQKTTLTRKEITSLSEGVWGKTGTLNGVSSLAGYLETKNSRRLAFSIIINGPTAEAKKIENTIVTLLLES